MAHVDVGLVCRLDHLSMLRIVNAPYRTLLNCNCTEEHREPFLVDGIVMREPDAHSDPGLTYHVGIREA